MVPRLSTRSLPRPAGPGLAFLLLLAHAGLAAEIPEAVLSLEASTPFAAGQDWGNAPPRFVLLEDGQVFVGGSSELLAGRLEKAEVKALEAKVEAVRKMPGLAPLISVGADEPAFHLRASKKPLDVRFTGDPATAHAAFRPLTSLLEHLLRFDHASLRPYTPGPSPSAPTRPLAPEAAGCGRSARRRRRRRAGPRFPPPRPRTGRRASTRPRSAWGTDATRCACVRSCPASGPERSSTCQPRLASPRKRAIVLDRRRR